MNAVLIMTQFPCNTAIPKQGNFRGEVSNSRLGDEGMVATNITTRWLGRTLDVVVIIFIESLSAYRLVIPSFLVVFAAASFVSVVVDSGADEYTYSEYEEAEHTKGPPTHKPDVTVHLGRGEESIAETGQNSRVANRRCHPAREDVLGQAISLLIADQTKQWTSAQVAQASNRVHYCSTQLKSLIQAGLQSEQIIRILCETNALPRTPVTYETLIANPALTIAKVAAALGADLTAWTPGKPHIEKQATSENDRFRARFLSELRTTLR